MPRAEKPIDMSRGPVAELAAELRALRNQADRPPYRDLAVRAGYSPAVLSQAASGRSLPSWPVVQAFVQACGEDAEQVERWERRWREVARAHRAFVDSALSRHEGNTAAARIRGAAGYGHADAVLQGLAAGMADGKDGGDDVVELPAREQPSAGNLEGRRAPGCISVFVVDDHEIVRRGIADLLEDQPDLTVVGEAGSVHEALARVLDSDVDVVVLDVRMPDGNGVELCRELRSRQPNLRCLILTSYPDDEALANAVLAGASGFMLKQTVGADLVAALRTVGHGGLLLDPNAVTGLLHRIRLERTGADPLGMLTAQERAVLDLIGQGLTNRQISKRLFLSEKTVKNYVSHLLAKLGLRHRTEAAVYPARRTTELYTQATAQLGSDRASARLGGLYALERLAQDNPEMRQTIVNVLCAYLRMPFTRPMEFAADEFMLVSQAAATEQTERIQEREVRLTAQRVLIDHLRPGAGAEPADTFWADIDLDLTGAILINFDLCDCHLRSARFTQATLVGGTTCERTEFTGDAWFDGVEFDGDTSFAAATFASEQARFDKARFAGDTSFDAAKFAHQAWFTRAEFHGYVGFRETRFASAETRFAGAADGAPIYPIISFSGAKFAGDVSFESAAFLGTSLFNGAEFAGNASFGVREERTEATFLRGMPPEIEWLRTPSPANPSDPVADPNDRSI